MEWLMIAYVVFGAFLFAAGGTQISSKIGGQKWIRRFLLPFIFGIITYFGGFIWWKALGVCLGYILVFHFGYGEKKPWWYRLLIGVSYSLPSLFLGITLWQILIPIIFIGMFLLSNWRKTAKEFPWKVCEASYGGIIGITLATLLSKLH